MRPSLVLPIGNLALLLLPRVTVNRNPESMQRISALHRASYLINLRSLGGMVLLTLLLHLVLLFPSHLGMLKSLAGLALPVVLLLNFLVLLGVNVP